MDKEIKLQKKDVIILIESLPKVKDSVQQCRDILLQAGFENVSSILAAFLLVDNTGNSSLVTVKSGKITIQNMEYVIEDDKITIYMKKPVVLNTGTIEDGGDTMIINGETLHRD